MWRNVLLIIEGRVNVSGKYFVNQKNQLVELYNNTSVVNHQACIYYDFILLVTTCNFIFDFNIVSIYKVKLINKL